MPSLETPAGKPVEVTAPDPDAVKAQMTAAMANDTPAENAPPRRTPRAKADDGEKPARRTRTPKAEKARTAPSAPKPLGDSERYQGVKGLAQIGAGLFLMVGKATKRDAFQADAVTIASNADQLADACVQTAQADAAFAARLDRICAVGPYGAMLTVGVAIVSQCARNHGANVPGTMDPAELLKAQAEAEADYEPAAA